jgi:uncharacterized protein YjbI with pentapeptide repeats
MSQQSYPFLDLITIHNRFPDCLDLDIEVLNLDLQTQNYPEFDLCLKLNCNQQWENILGGRVKFAIKGGKVQLNLKNCLISPQSRLQDGILTGILTHGQTPSNSSTSMVVKTEKIATTSHEENLSWLFYAPFGQQLTLQGIFENIFLGKVQISGDLAQIKGNFVIANQDIYLTDAEGLWKHDLSPNKHSILDRLIVKFLIDNRLQSILSYFHLGSRNNEDQETFLQEEEENTQELQETIEKIINEKTDNFLTLAKIANLNPKSDFAGGNLTGTNLRGLDLSESNFFRANFRGADLTDVDLSDSNLEGIKLSGADLSGAYLENSNLRFAYCQGTSFALCNLIGADLSYGYLVNTNLTNANLTNANTEGTKF